MVDAKQNHESVLIDPGVTRKVQKAMPSAQGIISSKGNLGLDSPSQFRARIKISQGNFPLLFLLVCVDGTDLKNRLSP